MKINIDLVKTGRVVKDVASVFVLVATSNINVYALNVSLNSRRVSINVNITCGIRIRLGLAVVSNCLYFEIICR